MTAPVHEIILTTFQPGHTPAEQAAIMQRISGYVSRMDGFLGRQVYYDDANDRWVDHLVWSSEETCDASAQTTQGIPELTALFGQLNAEGSVYARYREVTGDQG